MISFFKPHPKIDINKFQKCFKNSGYAIMFIYSRPRQTFLIEEPKSENNSRREPENHLIK